MKRVIRILTLATASATVLAGIAIIGYWLLFPRTVSGEAADESLRKSFDFDLPSGFVHESGVNNAIGMSLFLLADEDYHFVISAHTGINPLFASQAGKYPDFAGEADWSLTSQEHVSVRAQDVDLLKYAGRESNGHEMIGWVVVFSAKDGMAKVSVMGYSWLFSEERAMQFLQSIR